jgi:hypothetical protein
MRNHPKHTNKDRDATEQWAIKLIVYSNKDFDFAQVLDHCVPYIKVRQAFLYHHEGCSYVCGTESTIKKHKHPSNKAEYCRHHIVHQIFGQRDPKFTLIRGGVLPAAPLGGTVSEAPTLPGPSQAAPSAPHNPLNSVNTNLAKDI